MAGLMDNGDDNNASSYGQPGSMAVPMMKMV
jgi:hypothetical protein